MKSLLICQLICLCLAVLFFDVLPLICWRKINIVSRWMFVLAFRPQRSLPEVSFGAIPVSKFRMTGWICSFKVSVVSCSNTLLSICHVCFIVRSKCFFAVVTHEFARDLQTSMHLRASNAMRLNPNLPSRRHCLASSTLCQ